MRHYSLWAVILHSWIFMASLIMVLWTYRPKKFFDKYDWGIGNQLQRGVSKFIAWSSFVGLMVPIRTGYKSFLWFMPSSWGGPDEYGKWTSYSSLLSSSIAVGMAAFIIFFLLGHNEKRRNQIHK